VWIINSVPSAVIDFFLRCGLTRSMNSSLMRFLDPHNDSTQSVGLLWTSVQPEAETSTWQRTTLTTDRHPCPPGGFEPTIPTIERPQTNASDRAVTGIGDRKSEIVQGRKLFYNCYSSFVMMRGNRDLQYNVQLTLPYLGPTLSWYMALCIL
jgi:hypothetical protein